MKTFRDLQIELKWAYERARMDFANGFGISVIRGDRSRGGAEGFWEVAVMKGGRINYDTPITDDVIGWCTEEDVTNIMKQVQKLSPQEND